MKTITIIYRIMLTRSRSSKIEKIRRTPYWVIRGLWFESVSCVRANCMMKILNMEIFIQHRNFIHHSPVWSQIDLNLYAFGSYKRDISRTETHGGHERPNATVPAMCMACKCGLPAVCRRCTTQGSETTSTCFLQDSTSTKGIPMPSQR